MSDKYTPSHLIPHSTTISGSLRNYWPRMNKRTKSCINDISGYPNAQLPKGPIQNRNGPLPWADTSPGIESRDPSDSSPGSGLVRSIHQRFQLGPTVFGLSGLLGLNQTWGHVHIWSQPKPQPFNTIGRYIPTLWKLTKVGKHQASVPIVTGVFGCKTNLIAINLCSILEKPINCNL